MSVSYSNGTLVRRLLGLALEYRWGCVLLVALQTAALLCGLFGLTLLGMAIDTVAHFARGASGAPPWLFGLHAPAGWTPVQLTALLAAGVLAAAVCKAVASYCHAAAAGWLLQERMVVEMRARVFDKLQRLDYRQLADNTTGSLIARVTSDVQSVRMFIDGVALQLLLLALSLGFYAAYMLSIHVGLTLLCLATTPLLWTLSVVFCRVMRPAHTRNRDLIDRLLLVLSENIRGVQVVKGFVHEEVEIEKFTAANRAVKDQQQRIFWRISLYTPTTEFLLNLNSVALLGYGGYLAIHDQLAIGSGLLVFAGLLQQWAAQTSKVTNIINSVLQSLAGAQRVYEILDAPLAVSNAPGAAAMPRARGGVRFEHVEFGYVDGQPVLRDIDLRVEPGQCVAILGATGEGKTTLLNLIPRFLEATSGRVLIDGVDVRRLKIEDLRRNIGMVFQENFLFSDSVAANIALAQPDAALADIRRAAQIAAAERFVRKLPDGYDTVLREAGKDLSGGQRQRLAIARAILREPPILLLDDPTAAIDAGTEEEILQAMQQAMRGRTTFVVAHRLSTLRRADLVVVLEGGRIVECGCHEQLLAREGAYWRVAQLQSGVAATSQASRRG